MSRILWLASYPKSGNTWLRAFLHNLLRNPREPFDINQMSELTAGDSQAQWFRRLDPRPPTALSRDDLARLRPEAHALIAGSTRDTVMVKTHNALVEAAGRAHDHPVAHRRHDLRGAQPARRGGLLRPPPGPAGGRHHRADGDRGLRDAGERDPGAGAPRRLVHPRGELDRPRARAAPRRPLRGHEPPAGADLPRRRRLPRPEAAARAHRAGDAALFLPRAAGAGGARRLRRAHAGAGSLLPRRQGGRLARGAERGPGAPRGRTPPRPDGALRLRAGGPRRRGRGARAGAQG